MKPHRERNLCIACHWFSVSYQTCLPGKEIVCVHSSELHPHSISPVSAQLPLADLLNVVVKLQLGIPERQPLAASGAVEHLLRSTALISCDVTSHGATHCFAVDLAADIHCPLTALLEASPVRELRGLRWTINPLGPKHGGFPSTKTERGTKQISW